MMWVNGSDKSPENSSTFDSNQDIDLPVFKFQCKTMAVEYPLYGPYFYSFVSMITFDSLLSPITVILNMLILTVIFKNPCLRTIPNCILVNLAISDLLTGLISQPCKAAQTVLFLKQTSTCQLYITGLLLGYIFGMISCLTLALMALERYLAIFRPFLYIKMTVNRQWLYLSVGLIWTISIVIGTISLFTYEMKPMRIAAIGFIILTILSSAIVYTRAIIVVTRINKRVSAMPEETSHGTNKRGEKISTLTRNGRKLKATKMAALILLVMIACYLPSSVLTTLRNIVKMNSDPINGLHDWGQSFVLLNSSLNPIIYCWNLTEMRKKIILLIRKSICFKK